MSADLSPSFSPALRTPHDLAHTRPKERKYGTYLYRRDNLYYFRLIFPDDVKSKLGCSEIRLSLKTGYLREAKRYATILTGALKMALSGDFMLTYHEIRSRMHRLLQDLLMKDAQQLGSRNISFPELELEITPAELYSHTVHLYKQKIADESLLRELADRCVPRLIEKGIFSAEEVTDDNKLVIAKAFGEMEITYNDVLRKKEEGDFLAETHVLSTLLPSALQPAVPAAVEKTVSVLFSQAIEKYVQEKLDDGKWKEHSLPDHKYRLDSFVEIMGDMPVTSITDEEMREFRNILRKLPPNRSRSKAYAGKSIADILAMKPAKTLDIKTVNITVETVGSLLDWCVHKRWMQYNPAKGLQIKDRRQAIELRDSFSMDDLERIFTHPRFSEGTFKYPSYFWIPLIALYSGMRLEEISQLHCADVYESDSIWVFDINERGVDEQGLEKTVKNTNATRLVPIHKDLLSIGLLEYHKSIAAKGHIRLFPELTKTERSPKFGKQPSKQFKAVISAALDDNSKKTFHSIRHTFVDFYKQRGLQSDMLKQLCGHEYDRSSASVYGKAFPPKLLYSEVLSKLDTD